jgi:hypothetical protein
MTYDAFAFAFCCGDKKNPITDSMDLSDEQQLKSCATQDDLLSRNASEDLIESEVGRLQHSCTHIKNM